MPNQKDSFQGDLNQRMLAYFVVFRAYSLYVPVDRSVDFMLVFVEVIYCPIIFDKLVIFLAFPRKDVPCVVQKAVLQKVLPYFGPNAVGNAMPSKSLDLFVLNDRLGQFLCEDINLLKQRAVLLLGYFFPENVDNGRFMRVAALLGFDFRRFLK